MSDAQPMWECLYLMCTGPLPPADPANQQGVVHSKLNNRVQLLVSLVQQVIQLWDQVQKTVRHKNKNTI